MSRLTGWKHSTNEASNGASNGAKNETSNETSRAKREMEIPNWQLAKGSGDWFWEWVISTKASRPIAQGPQAAKKAR